MFFFNRQINKTSQWKLTGNFRMIQIVAENTQKVIPRLQSRGAVSSQRGGKLGVNWGKPRCAMRVIYRRLSSAQARKQSITRQFTPVISRPLARRRTPAR